jgi:hypothetical protein
VCVCVCVRARVCACVCVTVCVCVRARATTTRCGILKWRSRHHQHAPVRPFNSAHTTHHPQMRREAIEARSIVLEEVTEQAKKESIEFKEETFKALSTGGIALGTSW